MTMVDASIPLQTQMPKLLSPLEAQMQVSSLRDLQAQTQLRQQEAQAGMASLADQQKMAGIYANKGNLDPDTGLPSLDSMIKAGISAPAIQKMNAAGIDAKSKKVLDEMHQSTTAKNTLDAKEEAKKKVLEDSMAEYGAAAAKGPEAAQAAAQLIFANGIDRLKKSGMWSKEEADAMPTEFNPQAAQARLLGLKQMKELEEKKIDNERQDNRDKESRRHNLVSEERLAGIAAQAAAKAGQTEISADIAKLSGDDLLKNLSQSDANTVKAISDGRMTFSGLGVRGPARERLVKLVNQYDPKYDEADAKSRYKAMNDFATGKNGNTVRSLNVSIDHLDTLQKVADSLNNGNVQMFNQMANDFASKTGQSAPTDFNATKKIVADEIVKGIVGTGGGVHDREEAAKSISGANSPAQLTGVINRYKDLLGGQLHGLRKQYEATTKREDFNDRFLTQETRSQLEKREGSAKAASAPAYPTATNPATGEKLIFKDGKWQPTQKK